MITFTQTGTINAPVDRVFSTVADFSAIPLWRNDVPSISQISGKTAIGTTFVEDVHFMGKKHLLMKVTEFVPDKTLTIQAQHGMGLLPTQMFTFTADGLRTRIDLTVEMRLAGLFRLMGPMLPGQLKKIWSRYFSNLNALLSDSPQP